MVDLGYFYKNSLKQVTNNLRHPTGRAAAFRFQVKLQRRLLVMTKLVQYYKTVDYKLTGGNMVWINRMQNFERQWQVLENQKLEDMPKTLLITKDLPIIKLVEAFKDHLHQCKGIHYNPLAYVIREEVAVPGTLPTLKVYQSYSREYGSIEAEIIRLALYTEGLFCDDNSAVYFKLKEATRVSQYAATIKPFQSIMNRRAASEFLEKRYAGVDNWECELKKQENILHTSKWCGTCSYILERICQYHRNAFVTM